MSLNLSNIINLKEMSSLIGVKSHLSEPIKLRDGTAISEQDASEFRHLASNIA